MGSHKDFKGLIPALCEQTKEVMNNFSAIKEFVDNSIATAKNIHIKYFKTS